MTSDEPRHTDPKGAELHARDLLLKPVYLGLGVGDVIAERAQKAASDVRKRRLVLRRNVRNSVEEAVTGVEEAAASVLPRPGSGEGLIDNLGDTLTNLVRRATGNPEDSSADSGDDIPFGRGGARQRHARRTAARRRLDAELERESEGYVDRPKRTATSRTASPAPTGYRQEPAPEIDTTVPRLTPADLANPSGVEAASTAGRAARRAAARQEAEMLMAAEDGTLDEFDGPDLPEDTPEHHG